MSPGQPTPFTLRRALSDWFTTRLRRQLLWALVAALGLPWLVGTWAKQFIQPGLHNDAERAAQLVDFMVLGGIFFGLSMIVVWLVGCWVVAVMKGPALQGDEFPGAPEQDGPGHGGA